MNNTNKEKAMTETCAIAIDFDVHKTIENARRGFSETQNETLRRLLGIDAAWETPRGTKRGAAPKPPTGKPWRCKGVALASGTLLRMDYNGVEYTGEISNAAWQVEGRTFHSPSAAAGGIAKTKSEKSVALNGWNYWMVKRPGDADCRVLKDLKA
jgi:hypothetical protein